MPNAQEALSQDKTIRFIKRRWPSVILPLIIGCAMSFGAYYMDHSRIFAFVIVPLATIQTCFMELGISRKTLPRLAYPVWGIFSVYALGMSYWLLLNPMTK